MSENKEYKQALVRLVEDSDLFIWVVDNCPFCGEKHTHGGGPLSGDPRRLLGHRYVHCGPKGRKDPLSKNGYILVERM